MDIGIKIAQARRDLGITQIELAEKMYVTRQTVSRWESGTALPDLEKVASLAEILHVSCDYLLKDQNSDRESLNSEIENESTGGHSAVTRLLQDLKGKHVRISFFDDDMEIINESCRIDEFEGNWVKITIFSKTGEQVKLMALSSILSFDILNPEEV